MLLEGAPPSLRQPTSNAVLARLMDLDDLCLLQILQHLTPLPDLFHVALCSKRLQGLASGRRLFLVVDPDLSSATEVSPRRLPEPENVSTSIASPDPRRFSSIEAAVKASRPGNTILLKPGTHSVPHAIRVTWPLHFFSDSSAADETRLVAPRGLETALDFWASAKLTNVTIQAIHSPCVVHRKSSLLLDRCKLLCRPDRGMEHLSSPLVTVANGAPSSTAQASRHQGSNPEQPKHGMPANGLPGPGSLCVKETRILGSGQAVKCDGSGTLQGVRVIYQLRDPLFWFVVDSAVPGAAAKHERKTRSGRETGVPESCEPHMTACNERDGMQHCGVATGAQEPETPDIPASKRIKSLSPP